MGRVFVEAPVDDEQEGLVLIHFYPLKSFGPSCID